MKIKTQIYCPKCKSDNVMDDYPETLNDAFNWETDEMHVQFLCEDCGSSFSVRFQPVETTLIDFNKE